MVPSHRLRYLVAAVRGGSISAAATELRVAQSALSRQVAALEAQLGVSLLERTPQGVRPTPAGARLVERIAPLLDEIDRAVSEVGGEAAGGTLRLGYTGSASYETAPKLVAGLAERLPAADVAAQLLPRERLLNALEAGEIDLGIVRCPPVASWLEVALLRSERQGVVARADHPLLARERIELADVVAHPLLLHARTANPEHYDMVIGWFRAVDAEPVIRHRRVDFDARQTELEDGEVVAIVGPMGTARGDVLSWRPVADRLTLPVCLVTRVGGGGDLTRRAVVAAGEVAADLGWVGGRRGIATDG